MIKNNYKSNRKALICIIIALIWTLFLERKTILVNYGLGYRLLELLFGFCMTISVAWGEYYLFFDKKSKFEYRNYLFLLFLQLIAFMPMYTQNFLYGDDLWGFELGYNGDVGAGLYFGRPFIKFLYGAIPNISFLNINYFRIFNGICLFLFGCVLFKFLYEKSNSLNKALVLSVAAIASCVAVDCVAYASIYPINMSLLLSALSFIAYRKNLKEKGLKKSFFCLIAFCCLVTAFCLYQVGTSIVFLMMTIEQRYDESGKKIRETVKNIFFYLTFYGVTAIGYLIITKGLQVLTGIETGQGQRGMLISTWGEVKKKIGWFIFQVCPESFKKIVGIIVGNKLFSENNMFYICNFKNEKIGFLVLTTILVLVFFSIFVHKNFKYILVSIISIPLSFWVFLILPESTFLTYYAIPLIMLFVWFVIDAMWVIAEKTVIYSPFKWIKKERIYKYIILFSFVIIVLQSNTYSEKVWVNYNRDAYEYIANSLVSEINRNENIDTIVVEGTISPYVGGREYVIMCVEDILEEEGYNVEQFKIAQTDNGYYVAVIPDSEISDMYSKLGDKTMKQLLKYYNHDDMYSRWCYNGCELKSEDLDFMKKCFVKTGQLFEKTENTIFIDMNGFNIRNTF